MPITGTKGAADKAAGSNAAGGRATFRPPWVKEGPKPIPMPTESAPWTKRNSTAGATAPKPAAANGVQKEVKLQSREIKVPVVTTRKTSIPEPVIPKPKPVKVTVPEDNYETSSSEYEEVTDSEEEGSEEEVTATDSDEDVAKDEPKFQVKLKPVEKPPAPKVEKSPSTDKAGKFVRPVLKKVPKIDEVPKAVVPPPTIPEKKVLRTVAKPDGFKEPPLIEQKDFVRPPTVEPKTFVRPPLKKVDSIKKMPPPPPPAPPAPPPPPPGAPGKGAPGAKEIERISDKQKQTLEKLKIRPRRRPDWSDMMKEVESGRKLRHVETNDRSKPILKSETITNIQGQFVYETEKENVRNVFLKEIQFGIKLKSVKTNDRSKPVLDGLRKFRRQMTIEEQIQKSESRAQLGQLANKEEIPPEESGDEMDDIDKLRDDLQSTKQMLALELRNKEAQDRENKRLLAKIQQLEAELSAPKKEGDSTNLSTGGDNDALVKSLKAEAAEAQKTSKLLEKKYQDAAEQLDTVKSEVDEQKRKIANLERQLAQATGTTVAQSRRQSEAVPHESSPEPELEPSEGEEDEDEEKKAERMARRLVKEVKFLCSKLSKLKDKQKAARKERQNIRDAMKKNQLTLKDEKKKFKALQREVDKMAALMKEDDDDSDKSDDDEADAEAEAEVEEEAEAEESESEESESEAEADSDSESEAEDAPNEKKKENYEPRVKRHEGRLAALKKGNLLRQANLDRLIDEINRIRDEQVTLQRDLDSVLSELG